MKLAIFTEGNKKIGYGHITRCTSLYEAFIKNKVSTKIYINGDKSTQIFFKSKSFLLCDWIKNKKILKNLDKKTILIIDSYKVSKSFLREISKKFKLVVYIDDYVRINYPKGIVINGSIFADKLHYPKKNNIYLLGSKYMALRNAFLNVSGKKINKDIKNILLILGGNDVRNLTYKILKLLDYEFKESTKFIVSSYKNNKVANFTKIKNLINPSVDVIKKTMEQADIAISAGGQTLYELARIGVPTIAIKVADNQINNINGFKKISFIEYAGSWNDNDLLKNIKKLLLKINKRNLRYKMKTQGRKYIDGKGAFRIAKFVLNYANIISNK